MAGFAQLIVPIRNHDQRQWLLDLGRGEFQFADFVRSLRHGKRSSLPQSPMVVISLTFLLRGNADRKVSATTAPMVVIRVEVAATLPRRSAGPRSPRASTRASAASSPARRASPR